MENLRCPHDSETLEATGGSRSCPVCKGRWLPYVTLDSMNYPNGECAGDYFARLLRQSSKITALACPTGCGFLHETQHKGLALDCCKDCGGVWFDASELEQWAVQREPAGPSPKEKAEKIADQFDKGTDILDSLFSFF